MDLNYIDIGILMEYQWINGIYPLVDPENHQFSRGNSSFNPDDWQGISIIYSNHNIYIYIIYIYIYIYLSTQYPLHLHLNIISIYLQPLEGLLQPTVVIHDSQCWEVNEWFDPNVFTQTYLGISGMLGATKKNHPMLFPSTDNFPIFFHLFLLQPQL